MKILIKYHDNDFYSRMEKVCKIMLLHQEEIEKCLLHYSKTWALESYVEYLIKAIGELIKNDSNSPTIKCFINDAADFEMKYFQDPHNWDNNESVLIDFKTNKITFF